MEQVWWGVEVESGVRGDESWLDELSVMVACVRQVMRVRAVAVCQRLSRGCWAGAVLGGRVVLEPLGVLWVGGGWRCFRGGVAVGPPRGSAI